MNPTQTLAPNIRRRESHSGPPDSQGTPLLDQARGFAQVARDAINDCQRGEDALLEMQRRRNRSGQ